MSLEICDRDFQGDEFIVRQSDYYFSYKTPPPKLCWDNFLDSVPHFCTLHNQGIN